MLHSTMWIQEMELHNRIREYGVTLVTSAYTDNKSRCVHRRKYTIKETELIPFIENNEFTEQSSIVALCSEAQVGDITAVLESIVVVKSANAISWLYSTIEDHTSTGDNYKQLLYMTPQRLEALVAIMYDKARNAEKRGTLD